MKLSERMYKHGDTEDFTSIKAVYKWATEVAQLEAENTKLRRKLNRFAQMLSISESEREALKRHCIHLYMNWGDTEADAKTKVDAITEQEQADA